MKIISKFKDYYDGGMGLGIDNSIVYKRKTKWLKLDKDWKSIDTAKAIYSFSRNISISEPKKPIEPKKERVDYVEVLRDWKQKLNKYNEEKQKNRKFFINQIHNTKICICDKWYLINVFEFVENKQRITLLFTTADELLKKLKQHGMNRCIKYLNGGKRYSWRETKRGDIHMTELQALEYAQTEIAKMNKTEICTYYKVPYFLLLDSLKFKENKFDIVLNPNLRNTGLKLIKDPFTMFQEIQMFMGSLANPEPDMVGIDDKYRIDNHGFDKWSFRNQKNRRNSQE